MNGEETEIGGKTYRLGSLDAMKQFHVTRRLAPVLARLREAGADADGGDIMAVLLTAVGELSDADSEYVIKTCLAVCSRQIEGGAGYAAVVRGGQFMFGDMTMPDMLQLTWAVLQANLADFFTAFRSNSGAPAT